ncbi:DMT family transporter [Sphingomonas quercus]|uniref:DMT family transporter n=1 Tax=Sphingomonas quercus TaxID=2842451 RepID=A0ABS6BKT0_9SPHN|nr:DMT family transporter [Sphingomonas quercus]MBU3078903.1 DMT family transporter [Sphingomonas quercus]
MAPAPQSGDRLITGIMLRVGAACTYAIMSALLKLASERGGVVPFEMLFYRALFGMLVVLTWVASGPGLGALTTRRPIAHILRSTLGIVSILLTFQAIIMLPLELAITIGFTAPIFATLLSAVLLGEPVGPRRWAAVAIGFAGIVVATRPGSAGLPLAGVAVAIASALGQGSVTVTLRRLGRTEHPAAIVFWFFFCSAVVGLVALPFTGHHHDWGTFAYLAAGGLCGGAMQLMMTASLRFAPVSAVAPFDYLQIVWAIALGWTLWADAPAWTTLAGAALIAGSGLYTAWREHRLSLDRTTAAPVPVE